MTDADKSHAAEKTQADTTKNGGNGATARSQTRTVSHPRQVAALVLTQIDQVNAKKDELTIAIKALTDLTKQLATSVRESDAGHRATYTARERPRGQEAGLSRNSRPARHNFRLGVMHVRAGFARLTHIKAVRVSFRNHAKSHETPCEGTRIRTRSGENNENERAFHGGLVCAVYFFHRSPARAFSSARWRAGLLFLQSDGTRGVPGLFSRFPIWLSSAAPMFPSAASAYTAPLKQRARSVT